MHNVDTTKLKIEQLKGISGIDKIYKLIMYEIKVHHEAVPDLVDIPDDATSLYREFMKPNMYIYRILDDETMVGCIIYSVTDDYYFIEDLVVDEGYQNQGIATTAIEWLKEKAIEDGVKQIRLFCCNFNEKAHKLYEKLGYRDISSVMAVKLDK